MSQINKNKLNYNDFSIAILAGGKGTRIQSIDNTVPKPLVKICGKPVLFHQIDFLLENHFTNIYILAGYKGEMIQDAIETHYNSDCITTIIEQTALDTAGCLFFLRDKIKGKHLILISGDLIFDINLELLIQFHLSKKADCTLTVHSNSHPRDADLVSYNHTTLRVNNLLLRPHPKDFIYSNAVNAAISVFDINLLNLIDGDYPMNFEKDFLRILIEKNKSIFAHQTFEYIHDMGTPDRFYEVENDLKNEIPKQRRLHTQKKAFVIELNLIYSFMNENKEQICDLISIFKQINLSTFLLIGYNRFGLTQDKIKFIETYLGDHAGAKFDLIHSATGSDSISFKCFLDSFHIIQNDSYFMGEFDIGKKVNHYTTPVEFIEFFSKVKDL